MQIIVEINIEKISMLYHLEGGVSTGCRVRHVRSGHCDDDILIRLSLQNKVVNYITLLFNLLKAWRYQIEKSEVIYSYSISRCTSTHNYSNTKGLKLHRIIYPGLSFYLTELSFAPSTFIPYLPFYKMTPLHVC